MTKGLRWRDVFEEVMGSQPERAPSAFDALTLVTRRGSVGSTRLPPEEIDTSLSLGGGQGSPRLRMPLALTDNSGGQLSPQARLALLRASSTAGCALRLADPTPDLVELAHGLEAPLWVVIGPRRDRATLDALRVAAVAELKVADLIPGGGMDYTVDAWDSSGSLAPAVENLRTLTEGAWVVINMATLSEASALRDALESGADAVMVQAGSRASRMHPRLAGSDPLAAISQVRKLRGRSRPPEGAPNPAIVVSGGLKDGVEVAKALALGAGIVVLGTAARIALGCTLCGECGPGECPKMVLAKGTSTGTAPMDWKQGAASLSGYLDRLGIQLRSALAQMGCSSLGEATLECLEARDYDTAAVTGARLAGYGEPLPMWLH